jgi:hypothetical protein
MNEQPSTEAATCPHDDWVIRGPENIGYGTCVKCGAVLQLSNLINNWKARIDREIKQALDQ